jgi:short-subunit dehydrogenase
MSHGMPVRADFRAHYGPWALVAGAAVGLGAEYSRQIATKGLDLVLVDRDEGPLRHTAAAIAAASGVQTVPLVADLSRADIGEVLAAAVGGREIGLLVYNAAIGSVASFLRTTPAHSMTVLDVNCRGPLLLVHAFVPDMVARGRGGVILMSSMSGNYGSAQLAVYAATKAFNLVLGDALWFELGAHGVDVLAVQPGSTRTPGWQSSQPPELRGPGPHVMEPSEVVAAALAHLGDGPNLVPGEANQQGVALLAGMPRRQAVELVSRITRDLVPNV